MITYRYPMSKSIPPIIQSYSVKWLQPFKSRVPEMTIGLNSAQSMNDILNPFPLSFSNVCRRIYNISNNLNIY